MKRETTLAIAKLQVKDIERVTKRSSVLSSRIWRVATEAANRNFVHTENGPRIREFDPELKQTALDELVDIMAYAYLMRLRLGNKRRAKTKAVGLRLDSPIHRDAKRFADDFELDLGNIRRRFLPVAEEALDISLEDIRGIMNDALEESTIAGRPTPSSTKEVIAALRERGIEPRTSQYVETLVRTHSAIAYGAAHRVAFEGDTDLWGFEYITVGDDRVRPEHEKLDGIMRKKDDSFWDSFWPPNGWNCRCQVVAIYDEDARQTPVPDDVEPDEGFDFDPSTLVYLD